MSNLTPDDFTDDEQAVVVARLDEEPKHVAQVNGQVAASAAIEAVFQDLDDANRRVQEAAIDDLVTLLYGIVTQRDIDEPAEAPHFIRFDAPVVGTPSFPVPKIGGGALDDLSAATDLPTFLAGIGSYFPPFAAANVGQGTGWELWHKSTVPPIEPEVDPNPVTAGELGATFDVLESEFEDFQEARLNKDRGSYILLTQEQSSTAGLQAALAMAQARNAFYRSIGFTESES